VISMGSMIAYDHLCCKFLRRAGVTEARSRGAWLYLTGANGAREFVEAELKRHLPVGSRLADILRAAAFRD
jgi:hypothetical protein